MKKLSTFLIVIVLLTGSVQGSNILETGPGNPGKEKPQPEPSSFDLSKGYFSLFNIFTSSSTMEADTLRLDQFLRAKRLEPWRKLR